MRVDFRFRGLQVWLGSSGNAYRFHFKRGGYQIGDGIHLVLFHRSFFIRWYRELES